MNRQLGTRLRAQPFVSSILITILAGLLLRLSYIVDLTGRIASLFSETVSVRLIDVVFRMSVGALLVFLLIPVLLGYWRQAPWLKRYLKHMRVSLGTSPRKTVSATILSLIALVSIMICLALGLGVFKLDLGVVVRDDQWLILFLALVPAIWEELAFRGVILTNLQRRFSSWAAIVLSSVFFGLLHFSNLGVWDDVPSVVAGVIMATILGIGWGFLVVRTNSILPAIVLHYMINVLLGAEAFIDPLADDGSFETIALGITILWPTLTILITRSVLGNQPAGSSDAPQTIVTKQPAGS